MKMLKKNKDMNGRCMLLRHKKIVCAFFKVYFVEYEYLERRKQKEIDYKRIRIGCSK
jgi:hypothetical protein